METKIFNYPFNKKITHYCTNEIKNGNIGIFPTDTVYGIGCDSLNIDAIKQLYNIKNRNLDKPICILISNIEMINKFVKNINNIEQKLMETFWPGALTIIFKKSNIVPDLLTSGLDTIGIRMPNNELCLNIIKNLGNPIAMSSANLSNEDPNSNLNDLLEDFENKVSFILNDNNSNNKLPSTIVRVENNSIHIIREGNISAEDIKKCFGGNINVK